MNNLYVCVCVCVCVYFIRKNLFLFSQKRISDWLVLHGPEVSYMGSMVDQTYFNLWIIPCLYIVSASSKANARVSILHSRGEIMILIHNHCPKQSYKIQISQTRVMLYALWSNKLTRYTYENIHQSKAACISKTQLLNSKQSRNLEQ
jgi:hypothetical protein